MPADDHPPNPAASHPPSATKDSAAQFLIDRINYERTNDIPYGKREFKLERMGRLLERLGNPQLDLRVIHVAGSKGKGSTATTISSILSASGMRTGLFTSPHLIRLEERFRIDGNEINRHELKRLVQIEIQPIVTRLDEEAVASGQPWDTPTFFEITTAAAMVYFREQQVEAAVLEVGLGGRLDSTNICHPVCCVITSISLDHTKQLGSTHAEIAGEKSGILKPRVPLVTAATHPKALATITSVAEKLACPQWTLHKDFDFEQRTKDTRQTTDPTRSEERGALPKMDYQLKPSGRHQNLPDNQQVEALQLDDLELGMWGEHQAANAAVAVTVAHLLRSRLDLDWDISNEAIRTGLRRAICPARIELVSERPRIVVDTAHNQASMRALITTLDQRFDLTQQQRTVVFATSKGKNYRSMLELLAQWSGRLILTKYQENPRGVPIEQLRSSLDSCQENTSEVLTAPTPADALRLATSFIGPRELADDAALICATGSFFLAAEILAILRP